MKDKNKGPIRLFGDVEGLKKEIRDASPADHLQRMLVRLLSF